MPRQKSCGHEYSVTPDWLYRGDRSMVPHHLALEIAHTEAAERKCQPPSSLYISFLLTGSRFL